MTCHNCQLKAVKAGKDRKGSQRFLCRNCKRYFQAERERLLGNMNLPDYKIELVLRLLLEGNSIRSIERITGIEKKTITRVLLHAGEHCEQLMSRKIKGVAVRDVEADEIWGFVGCKNRHKLYKGITDPKVGDSYTWVGIERNTKLVLAWHLGQRDMTDCEAFTEKRNLPGTCAFQLSTTFSGGRR